MIIFFHPDFTVGSGISPDRPFGSRALPPVGNHTLPRRSFLTFTYTLMLAPDHIYVNAIMCIHIKFSKLPDFMPCIARAESVRSFTHTDSANPSEAFASQLRKIRQKIPHLYFANAADGSHIPTLLIRPKPS